MKFRLALLACLLLTSGFIYSYASEGNAPNNTPITRTSLRAAASRMPLPFTKNMGQWPDEVLFRTNSGGATIWITKTGLVYQFMRRVPREDTTSLGRWQAGFAEPSSDRERLTHGNFAHEPDSIEQLIVRATFVGCNPEPEVIGLDQLEYKCNYFLGNDPAKWRTDVPNYSEVILKDIYPGVDLEFSSDEMNRAECELVAAAVVLSERVNVQYEGMLAAQERGSGQRTLRTHWGDLLADLESAMVPVELISAPISAPSAPPNRRGDRTSPSSTYAMGAASTLLGLVYSTYLGGSSVDQGWSIEVDSSGAAYVAGTARSSNFPTSDAYQATPGGSYDAFVAKLSKAGDSLLYSTYLGGSNADVGLGVGVDASGAAYITGWTLSINFPTVNAYQVSDSDGFSDAFVAKLSTGGNSLEYGTYLSGNRSDWGYDIAVNGSTVAYITGWTESADFPTASAWQDTNGGGWDAFLTALSSAGNTLVYSTYLGGNVSDRGEAIAVDATGAAYVTGYTESSDFPITNAYQTNHHGGVYDAFVAKFSADGSTLEYSTYLGGSDYDEGYGLSVDASGAAFVAGRTYSTNFPIANAHKGTLGGDTDAFVTKLSIAGNSIVYSTYLGGSNSDGGLNIAVDVFGAAYLTGYTNSSDFPTTNPYQAALAGEANDAFVAKLSSTGSSIVYSTYLGGDGGDEGHGITVDASGAVYATGVTEAANFPTANAWQEALAGTSSAFVTKLSDTFMRGDMNGDGLITSADIIYLVNHVFKSGPPPPSVEVGDVNCSASITSADIISLVNYIFRGGPAPC